MTTKHTPGEWVADAPKKTGKHWRVGARGRLGGKGAATGAACLWWIASIHNGAPGDTLETEAANARLVASAPALLDACRSLLALAVAPGELPEPRRQALLTEARAAIRKAQGEA